VEGDEQGKTDRGERTKTWAGMVEMDTKAGKIRDGGDE
jgi:hypothetical protein